MVRDDITVRLAGESGEGVISSGDILTTGAARAGYWAQTFRTYPAEIRGGPCMYQVRVGVEPVSSQGDAVDLLICFNQEAFDLHHRDLAPDGHIVCDAESVRVTPSYESRSSEVSLGEIAQEAGGNRRGKNMVSVGLVCGLLGIDIARIEEMILKRYAHKGDVGEANIKSLRAGCEHARERLPAGAHKLAGQTAADQDRVLVTGNQAICLGALQAGLGYYAGYPITPASDILEWLAARLPRFGGVAIQTEDEIAALASVLGASYAGEKAMTATSGPGLSLMAELVGLAGMAEIPAVIVDAQRSGPSTGMPTKTEQSDLNHALFGGHGEAPRVVMAPTSVEDCFEVIVEAFNAAERYQVPVIVLSDQSLSHRLETVVRPDLESLEIGERVSPNGDRGERLLQPICDPRGRRVADGGAGRPGRVRVDRHRARRGRQPPLRARAAHGDDGEALPQARAAGRERGPREHHRPRARGRRHPRLGIDRGRRGRGGRDLPRPRPARWPPSIRVCSRRCRSSASASGPRAWSGSWCRS